MYNVKTRRSSRRVASHMWKVDEDRDKGVVGNKCAILEYDVTGTPPGFSRISRNRTQIGV
jgi:hypothetical protein